jgi:hypothetical protein
MHSFPNESCPKVKVKNVPDSYHKTEKCFTDTTSQHPFSKQQAEDSKQLQSTFHVFCEAVQIM